MNIMFTMQETVKEGNKKPYIKRQSTQEAILSARRGTPLVLLPLSITQQWSNAFAAMLRRRRIALVNEA